MSDSYSDYSSYSSYSYSDLPRPAGYTYSDYGGALIFPFIAIPTATTAEALIMEALEANI